MARATKRYTEIIDEFTQAFSQPIIALMKTIQAHGDGYICVHDDPAICQKYAVDMPSKSKATTRANIIKAKLAIIISKVSEVISNHKWDVKNLGNLISIFDERKTLAPKMHIGMELNRFVFDTWGRLKEITQSKRKMIYCVMLLVNV